MYVAIVQHEVIIAAATEVFYNYNNMPSAIAIYKVLLTYVIITIVGTRYITSHMCHCYALVNSSKHM